MKRTSLIAVLTVALMGMSTVVASSASACSVTKSKSASWTKVEARDNCLNVQARIDKYIQGSGIRTSLGYQGPTLSVAVDYGGIWSGALYRTRGTGGAWTGWSHV